MRRLHLAFALFCALAPRLPGASFDYWLTGSPADARPAKMRAGLFLSGGGGDVIAAWQWFVACAGGGDVVVLRASGADGYNDYIFHQIGGVDSVETIRFNEASAAHDSRVLDIIARADGIFIAGGDQSKYVTYWKGTPVGDALNAHLRAGKPLGGTSAGLAILGQYYFSALEDSITSAAALADPFDKKVTLGSNLITAPVLVGVITDSHFSARQRLGRLVAFVSRLAAEQDASKPSTIVGLGIDEATAVCIEPDGAAKVFTEKQGRAWLVMPAAAVLVPGKPLATGRVKVVGVGPESALHFAPLNVDRPATIRHVRAADGKLTDDPSQP